MVTDMKKKKTRGIWAFLAPLLVLAAAAACFFAALSDLESGRGEEEKRQLEDAVRRAAVACYAAEGAYPPDIGYLTDHYGIQIDASRFIVEYDAIAENLMPDITVLDAQMAAENP